MRVLLLAAALAALALSLAACGSGDDDLGVKPVPAAGDLTPPNETPGVPPGATYDLTGSEFDKLSDPGRFRAVFDYIADHPDDCTTGVGTAAGNPVLDYVDTSLGTDFPLNAPIAELVAEGCASALQSVPPEVAQ